jgi:ketol-acid reductoisomerase
MTRYSIIGFGSQARAWAANLRDGGLDVTVLARAGGQSFEEAEKAGFTTLPLQGESKIAGDNILLLTPDHTHQEILEQLGPRLTDGCRVVYAHGFSYTARDLKEKFPTLNHLLLAPKAIASEVRRQFTEGGKLGAVYSVEGVNHGPVEGHRLWLLKLADRIGITAGPWESSFQDETFADLFSEQSLLCSLLPYGALESYNRLRAQGIRAETAYMECWLEVKLIAEAMTRLGPKKFFELISPNALAGGEKARELIFDRDTGDKLDDLLDDVWSGRFNREVEETNMDELRTKVLNFWDKQELTSVHEKLAPELME